MLHIIPSLNFFFFIKLILFDLSSFTLYQVENVICPGSASQCPDGNTCCKLASGEWGCCPIPNVSHSNGFELSHIFVPGVEANLIYLFCDENFSNFCIWIQNFVVFAWWQKKFDIFMHRIQQNLDKSTILGCWFIKKCESQFGELSYCFRITLRGGRILSL